VLSDTLDFRLVQSRDISAIVALYQEFFAESTYPQLGLVFDPDRVTDWLHRSTETGASPHIGAFINDRGLNLAVGSINYVIDHTATVEPFAFIDKFYVHRDWRAAGIGAVLLELVIDAARGDGAVALRAGLSAGTPGVRKLFNKQGFQEVRDSVLMERGL
jgi:GNAT superfamily N-acetyltransferase